MLPRLGQSSKSAGFSPQIWLSATAAGIGMPRAAKRGLERAAGLGLFAASGAPGRPRRSLSHSSGCAAIAIAPVDCVAGVDIETSTPRDVRGIAQFAFAHDELRELQSLAEPEAMDRFYVLWTLKEAFAKALGIPLVTALRSCSFTHDDGRWTAGIPSAASWRAIVFKPRPALTLASAIIGPRRTTGDEWSCVECPGVAAASWPCLATLASDDH